MRPGLERKELLPRRTANGGPGVILTLMLIALLTLIVTLYDRYRNLRVASFSMVRPSAAATAPA